MFASLAVWAQAPEAPPVFQAGASLVRVDVQVTSRGAPVDGLTASDFAVLDNGRPAGPLTLDAGLGRLEVLLVLDVSGSMGRLLGRMGTVAQSALGVLHPDDRVGVMLFARRSEVVLDPGEDRRAAAAFIRDAAVGRHESLGAGSSLNEAVLAAANYFLDRPYSGRRALVVLTDNGGLSQELPDERVVQELSRAGVVLNAIVPDGVNPPKPPPKGVVLNPDYTPANVFRLAEESGGEWMRTSKPERLGEMLDRIRRRYALSYRAPESSPGEWRTLSVDLMPQARSRIRDARLRARPGYFASSAPPTGTAR